MEREQNTSAKSSKGDPAVLWHKEADGKVVCDLCAHRCRILPGKAGVCQVRLNRGGELVTLVLNRLIAVHTDPIEKKPLYHFLPGSRSLSIATVGCNFRCSFCQNWQISQHVREFGSVPGDLHEPQDIVRAALSEGCASISYTYTEPTIFFETCEEVGILARERGLKNNFVTNGYMTREAVKRASAFLDAANVDLKGFDDSRYRKVCGATLRGVQSGLEALVEAGVWVEVTTLVVPGMNDSEEELRAVALYIASLGPDVPWHVSRYHPDYKMDKGHATPLATLQKAYAAGKEAGLRHVYLGNVPGHDTESTFCPKCGTMVVGRMGFRLVGVHLEAGACGHCGTPVAGVWS